MSILINGMKMPKSCRDCPCFCEEYFYCRVKESGDIRFGNRPKDCPLVPVPPHGRLIDADALLKEHYEGTEDGEYIKSAGVITPLLVSKLPTIIPAEEGET